MCSLPVCVRMGMRRVHAQSACMRRRWRRLCWQQRRWRRWRQKEVRDDEGGDRGGGGGGSDGRGDGSGGGGGCGCKMHAPIARRHHARRERAATTATKRGDVAVARAGEGVSAARAGNGTSSEPREQQKPRAGCLRTPRAAPPSSLLLRAAMHSLTPCTAASIRARGSSCTLRAVRPNG